jgi:methionyl aminopeptidase
MITRVKTPAEIDAMRRAGNMLASVLQLIKKEIEPGMSTKDVAELAKVELRRLGGQPSFLGYQGFPDVICISVNDEVVHGIPRADRILAKGDVVGLDFGVTLDEMITDGAITVIVGNTGDQKVNDLVRFTEEALLAGINAVRAGAYVGDIGAAVQKVLDSKKYGIVRDLVGHGVGHQLHEEPNIPNYGRAGTGMQLEAGMTIAIEPMATLGRHDVLTAGDNWTIKTRDGSLAAHFEHTVLVTTDGAEILTQA